MMRNKINCVLIIALIVKRIKSNLNFFIILCSVFLCSACGNSSVNANIAEITEDGLYKITIRPPDMDTLQNLYLSEIADSVYYVALSDNPLLGPNLKVIKTENSIIVKDSYASLKLYDFSGNFKRKIGDIGRGAGEYIYPVWTVNKRTDVVYLNAISVRPNMMSVYSLSDDSDGKMTGSITNIKNITDRADWLYSLDNTILVGSTTGFNPSVELTLYNPQTNIIIDFLPNYHNSGGTHNNGYGYAITGYKDELYYMNVYSDTLYRVTEKEIAPFAIFDFGKYKFPIKMTTNDVSKPQKRHIILNSVILKSILRTSSTLYLRFTYGRDSTDFKRFTYALNLDDKTVRYCKPSFINDLDNGPNTWSEMQTIDVASLKATQGDDEIGSKSPFGRLPKNRLFPDNKMVKIKKLKNVDEFQRLWDKSTENSNPIIQFLKLK